MNNRQREYCGHINSAGAEDCETCDFPLGNDGAGVGDGPSGGPSWMAGSPAVYIPAAAV